MTEAVLVSRPEQGSSTAAYRASAQTAGRSRLSWLLLSCPTAALVAICCALPLAWLLWVLLSSPEIRSNLDVSSFRLGLLGRTLFYNVCVAVLASALGFPAALVLGRGPAAMRRLLWIVVPVSLLMPSLAYAYGWSQFIRLCRPAFDALGISLLPASPADVARCIWTLAAWLWPVPAVIIGLALQRMDVSLQQHAVLEGALWRITCRQLLEPIIASMAIVMLLATQEFAVYEPTGISVVATEVRMVFETGAFSGMSDPITTPRDFGPDQAQRAAAAVATALPLLLITLLLAWLASVIALKGPQGDSVHVGQWPLVLRAPAWASILSLAILAIVLVIPIASLVIALRVPLSPERIWIEFGPELSGALSVAGITVLLALVLGFASAARWTRGSMLLFGLCFLIGGQLLAIALIRLWNRPGLAWAYNSFPVPVLAYLGRFGWLALAAARGTWGQRWDDLRATAAVDGAGPLRTALWVIWPLTWPTLLAGCLVVGALSMTEVAATVLLQPQNPRVLTPMLATWVHMARYDPMIEASLLMMSVVVIPWALVVLLTTLARRRLGTSQ